MSCIQFKIIGGEFDNGDYGDDSNGDHEDDFNDDYGDDPNGDYDDDFNGTRRPKFGLGLSRDVSRAVLLNSYPPILIFISIIFIVAIAALVMVIQN